MVGDLKNGQNLSIGAGCDYKAIVEHEILHALGFYHEQSRMDRDDYVTIWWDEILTGWFGTSSQICKVQTSQHLALLYSTGHCNESSQNLKGFILRHPDFQKLELYINI